jgi:hypothetical protein
MNYKTFINEAQLIKKPHFIITTGDPDYPGTALEVFDNDENEIFHFVVNQKGEKQLLFFGNKKNFRLSIEDMEFLINNAREKVKLINDN